MAGLLLNETKYNGRGWGAKECVWRGILSKRRPPMVLLAWTLKRVLIGEKPRSAKIEDLTWACLSGP